MGAETFVYLRAAGLDVVAIGEPPLGLADVLCARVDGTLDVRAGDRVALEVRPELVRLFDEETGRSRLADGGRSS